MTEPKWSDNRYPPIDLQDMCYYSEPKKKPTLNSLDEADPELVKYFDKLGVPLNEQNQLANVAVDTTLNSVSIATTHRKTLEKAGVIFCSITEAIREYPDLVRKFLGNLRGPLIVANDRSFVEYLEGCTTPSYDRNQLHAAMVELYCVEDAEIKYSTVQNWYARDEQGKGGIYNFVTKRGLCAGAWSKISWTQVETGSAITWKYPSVSLDGDDTVGEFLWH
ncbi:hypothetical protein ACSBR2_042202 [Camellia fascicularis]